MLVSPRLSRNRRADLSPASRLRPASTRLSVQNAVSAFATSVFVIRWNSSCSWSKTILISIHYNQHKYSTILWVNVSPQLTAMEYLSVASCVCAYMWIVIVPWIELWFNFDTIKRNWIDVMRNNDFHKNVPRNHCHAVIYIGNWWSYVKYKHVHICLHYHS